MIAIHQLFLYLIILTSKYQIIDAVALNLCDLMYILKVDLQFLILKNNSLYLRRKCTKDLGLKIQFRQKIMYSKIEMNNSFRIKTTHKL